MAEISDDYFSELRVLPLLFGGISLTLVIAALVRRTWAMVLPLLAMAGAAAYGFWSMNYRLHQFGTDLDPMAAMKIEPFVPPMLGANTIAQFATYSYFSWGTFLPMAAGLIAAHILWLDLRDRRRDDSGRAAPARKAKVRGASWRVGEIGLRGGQG
jgi:hypothetical protein